MPRRIEKIREAGREELEAQHKELTELIFRLRFQLTTGQAEALKRLREAKKDLARVKTLLRAQALRKAEMATETKAATADARGERTVLTGKVTSAKMEKTIVVEIIRLVQHPKYRRVVRIAKRFYAHDEKRQAKPGDTVRIVASRPISKLKRWRLKEVLTSSASAK